MALPEADASVLLASFLTAHAQVQAVPAVLVARGEELYARLQEDPPRLADWGRFLVALGQLTAEVVDDAPSASRYFLRALKDAERHGDHEAALTAGYNQGVLLERRGRDRLAAAAYRAAAQLGVRGGLVVGNSLRSAMALLRMHFEEQGSLDEATCLLAKQAWLGWLYLRCEQPQSLTPDVVDALQRSLCAFLLPEDDPAALASRWRAWAPATLMITRSAGAMAWRDDQPECLAELFAASAESAAAWLGDEHPDPGAPYRLLGEALRRSLPAGGGG